MTTDFFTPYARGGAAARPDSFTGMGEPFQQALQQMLRDAPEDVKLGITSGYRSPETQERLWKAALAKYGSEKEARKWVAPPGKSQHNHGNAADLEFMSPAAQRWVHKNAPKYGLAFPLSNENWHVELSGAREAPALGQSAGNALSASAAVAAPFGPLGAAPPQQAPASFAVLGPPPVTFNALTLPPRRRRA